MIELIEKVFGADSVELVLLVVGVAYMLVEYVLGKTTIVRPNSVLESVLEFLKTALEKIKGDK